MVGAATPPPPPPPPPLVYDDAMRLRLGARREGGGRGQRLERPRPPGIRLEVAVVVQAVAGVVADGGEGCADEGLAGGGPGAVE